MTSSADVLAALEVLAPLRLAEDWDNVGLLVDPGLPAAFSKVFCTIDLTDTTLAEAIKAQADLIMAYHPPIFGGLKRLRASQPGERLVVRALQQKLPVYSPHTALDASPDGMNDWLAQALGSGHVEPIVADAVTPAAGAGRLVRLDAPIAVDEALARLKKHLGLSHLRASIPAELATVTSLAVCPGAGGSLFEKVGDVDMMLTGEMRHHDILARCARSTSVVLTDHTNTERGYLPLFAKRLEERCPGLRAVVSQADADPLRVV